MDLISDETRAGRLARVMMDEIGLYQMELVNKGINDDSIFELLDSHIEEARQEFAKRVTPEIMATKIFDYAIVDILIKRAYKHKTSDAG